MKKIKTKRSRLLKAFRRLAETNGLAESLPYRAYTVVNSKGTQLLVEKTIRGLYRAMKRTSDEG